MAVPRPNPTNYTTPSPLVYVHRPVWWCGEWWVWQVPCTMPHLVWLLCGENVAVISFTVAVFGVGELRVLRHHVTVPDYGRDRHFVRGECCRPTPQQARSFAPSAIKEPANNRIWSANRQQRWTRPSRNSTHPLARKIPSTRSAQLPKSLVPLLRPKEQLLGLQGPQARGSLRNREVHSSSLQGPVAAL